MRGRRPSAPAREALFVNCERNKQDVRDTKFEVLGSKFRKPRTLPRLARPAFLASLASLTRIMWASPKR